MVGNGNVGIILGPRMWWQNAWPWRDAGNFKVAGFYNGYNYTTPSHRAQIPSLIDVFIARDPAGNYTALGMALNFRQGVVYNRTGIDADGCRNTQIEQRYYAHRLYPSLFVYELVASPFDSRLPWTGCLLPLISNLTTQTPDLDIRIVANGSSESGAPSKWSATTLLPEEPNGPVRHLEITFSSWLTEVAANFPQPGTISFTSSATSWRLLAEFHSDAGNGETMAHATVWKKCNSLRSDQLLKLHIDAWDLIWSSGNIELGGNATIGASVNASLYDIYSSMRNDVIFSTSPGGLAGGGYCGHVFWDMETWMYPVLTVLQPSLAHMATKYRIQRSHAARKRANAYGYTGAFWPWESAYTGLDASPWRDADVYENHVSADIVLAWRQYYRATGDLNFLKYVWESLHSTCQFWECRFTRTGSTPSSRPTRTGPNCSPKNGNGNWTVRNVICPDEASGVVNDSAYTNAAAGQALEFCIYAANQLNASEKIPPLWRQIANNIYLPLTTALNSSGPVHQEYTGFDKNFHQINQADVALLQYPLGLRFDRALMKRDLDYWSSVTMNGMFTGDASYSNAYLALGERESADVSLALAWTHLDPHFFVFTELPYANYSSATSVKRGKHGGDGTQHFITGAGGYLQNFVFGYPGLRLNSPGIFAFRSQRLRLPPFGVTSVRIRSFHLLGGRFSLFYNATQFCVNVTLAGKVPFEIRFQHIRIPLKFNQEYCSNIGPFDVAGIDY